MKDYTLTTTKAFPAAGYNAEGNAIDIGARATTGSYDSGALPRGTELVLSWTAAPNLVNGKNVVMKVQDSADNNNFADTGLNVALSGAGGLGAAAGSKRFRLPPQPRRWLRLLITAEAGAGDNTASLATTALDLAL